MTMTIKLNILDPASIDAAIAKLKKAEKQLIEWEVNKTYNYADYAVEIANRYLADAQYAGDAPDVHVYKDAGFDSIKAKNKCSYTVHMDGAHAGIIEFGSGIAFENEYQASVGYYPGSYNPGSPYALQPYGWFYTGGPGDNPPEGTELAYRHRNTTHTYGNPPNRVMWNTVHDRDLIDDIYASLYHADIFYD